MITKEILQPTLLEAPPTDGGAVDPNRLNIAMFGEQNSYLFDRPPIPEIPENYLPPNAKVVVDIGEHVTVDDLAGVDNAFDRADIFIPEAINWTKAMRRTWQEIARGNEGAYVEQLTEWGAPGAGGNAVGHDFRSRLISTIFKRGEGKTIAFIDAAAGELRIPDLDFSPGKTSQETVVNYGLRVAKSAYLSAQREPLMVRNLGPTVRNIVAAKRELQKKDPILVLLTAGGDHIEAFEHIATSPNIADGQVEIRSRIRDDGESVYQRELLEAFRDLRMPTRQQVVSPLLWNALTLLPDMRHPEIGVPFPIEIRHAIMKQMAETPEAADIAHAILTGKLSEDLAITFTDHVNAALQESEKQ